MPLLVACWRLPRLMKNCFQVRWTCPQFSESYHLIWICHFLIKAHVFRLVCVGMEAYASSCSFQTMQQCFSLGGCICQKCYVIGVDRVRNCLCVLPSASFLCQLQTVVFHYINWRKKKWNVRRMNYNYLTMPHNDLLWPRDSICWNESLLDIDFYPVLVFFFCLSALTLY